MEVTLTPVELKKDRGRRRYEARYARVGAERAKQKRMRWSDSAQRRYGDGIPPRHEARVTNRFVRKEPKKLPGILTELFGK